MKNKSLVIFGGSGGIGKQLTPLLERDYNVLSLSSKDVDITNYFDIKNFFLGNVVDIVVNLSGYNFNCFLHKYNDDVKLKERDEQVNVVINGTLNIMSNCLPQMRERGYGRIILTSSILASKPVAGTSIYSGCKAFMDNLAKTCSVENLSRGITCNTLQLGYMDGGLTYKVPEPFRRKIKENMPLKRWGTIEEIQNTIKYLINTEYVSGCAMKVNGGLDF